MVVLPGCVWAQGQVAVAEGAAFGSAVFGDIAVFSSIGLLPFICNSNAGKVAFSRFERPFGSPGYGKRRHNCSWFLSYPNSSFCYGFFDALGGSAVRHNDNLLPRRYVGLL